MASVPGMLLNGTGPAASAGIAGIGTDASPEEALASLAALHAKVVARGRVTADPAEGLLHVVVGTFGGNVLGALGVVITEHV